MGARMADETASIGIKVETDGIARGIKSLDELASRGPKVEKALDGVSDASKRVNDTLGGRGVPGINMGAQAITGVGKAAEEAAKKLGWYRDAQGRMRDENGRFVSAARQTASGIKDVGDSANSAVRGVASLSKAMTVLSGALTVAGLQKFVGITKDVTQAFMDASIAGERMRIGLDFASSKGSASELEFLRGVTNRLGLEFYATAHAYTSFTAATKGTALEGEKTRAVFESISKAVAVMGLSADQASGVLLALQQMVSKGTVQAEELRGQLGERLPGAFQIAAKAMGVTTAELGKMLEQGQVISDDFLPKFAKALEASLGDAPEKAATRLEASINRQATAWTTLKQTVGDSGLSRFWAGQMDILADGMTSITESMEQAKQAGGGFTDQMLAGSKAAIGFANPLNAFSYSVQSASVQLTEAEKRLVALKKQAEIQGSNAALNAQINAAQQLVDKLREAKSEQAALTGAIELGDNWSTRSPWNSGANSPEAAAAEKSAAAMLKETQAYQSKAERMAEVRKQGAALKTQLDELTKTGLGNSEMAQQLRDRIAGVGERMESMAKSAASGGAASKRAAEVGVKAAETQITSIRAQIKQEQELIDRLTERGTAAERLTEGERIALKIQEELAGKMTAKARAQKEAALSEAQRLAGMQKTRAEQEKQIEQLKELAQLELEYKQAVWNEDASRASSLQDQNKQLAEEVKQLGLSTEQVEAYAQAKLDLLIIEKEQQMVAEERADFESRTYQNLRSELEMLKQRKQLLADKSGINRQIEATKAWAETLKDVDSAMRDVFVNMTDDIGGSFERLWKSIKAGFMSMIYQLTLQRWIINIGANLTGTSVGQFASLMGVNGGGIGGLLNNGSTAYSAISNGASLLGLSSSAGASTGSLVFANGVNAVGGDGLGALIAANGNWSGVGAGIDAVAGGAAGGGGGGMGALGNAALPLAVFGAALFAMSKMPDRPDFAGFASASSDPTQDRAGAQYGSSTSLDLLGGVLPSRDALLEALTSGGVDLQREVDMERYRRYFSEQDISALGLTGSMSDLSTQALYWMNQDRVNGSENSYYSNQYGSRVQQGEFYTGAGYVDPTEMGIGADNAQYNADWTAYSRRIAEGVLATITTAAGIAGEDADGYRVVTGLHDRGRKDNLDGYLQISQNGESLVDWMDKVGDTQEYLRGIARHTLAAFEGMDLPGWADTMVAQTRTAIDELDAEELGDKLGQTAMAALDALNANLAQTAAILDRLGKSVLEFGGYSSDVIHQITTLMGGVDGFGSAYSAYVQAFYSEQEQLDLLQRQLQEQFGALNVTMPASIAGFRALVESLDLNEESSRSLFASLLQISPQFAQFATAMDAAGEAVKEVTKTVADLYAEAKSRTDGSFAAYQKNQQKIVDEWSGVQAAAEETADEVRSIFDLLHDSVRELRGEVSSTKAMQVDQANAYISQALAAARATGVLPEYDGLSDAIGGARSGLDPGRYSSRDAWEKDQLILAGKLEELEGYADSQLTAAERQAQFAKEQISLIQREIELFQEQIAAIRDGNKFLGTIAELAQAILDERAAAEAAAEASAAGAAGVTFPGGSKGGGASGAYPVYETREEADAERARINAEGGYATMYNIGGAWRVVTSRAVNGQASYDRQVGLRDSLNTVSSAAEWWSNAARQGATKDEIAAALNVGGDDLQKWIKTELPGYQLGVNGTLEKLPSYAVGTPFVPADGLAMIHKGERILTAADNRMITDAVLRSSGDANTDRMVQTLQAGLGAVTRQLMDVKRQLKHGVLTVDPLKETA